MQFRLRLSLRQLLIQMARRPDLLCGAIVLSCTLILSVKFAYSRAKNVVSPARPPVRFFSPSAPIIDLYLGQLDQVERLRSNSDVTLIYFYAPWCGESISARVAIEQVAKKLSDQVQFIAINCWWNQGKCRKQKNFYYYPVIYVYYRRFGPIEYTGPFTAAYLERFVRRVIAPLVYIPSEERLKKFLSHYEPGVLGYFEFNTSPQPPGYLTFLMSALQALKRDFQGVLRFGVITSRQLANRISLTSHGTVFMHRHFNTSLIFPRDALNFTSENICKWAYENLELFYRWLRPHGGKSRLMDKELKKGAALLVFLPFDPLAESQPQIDEVADIAVQYHNCNRIPTLNPSLEAMGIMTSPEYSAFQSSHFLCCNTVVIPQWHSVSRKHNVCELCINHSLSIQPTKLEAGHCQFQEMGAALDSFYLREHTFTRFMSPNVECSNIHDLNNPFRYYSACCKTVNTSLANNMAFLHPSAIWRHGYIPFSQVKEAHKDPQNIVPHIEDDIYLPFRTTSVTGLKCITNKTLHFYLLDSYLHWTFAVRLGASENDTMKKFVTIVNLPEEIHHVLDQKEAIQKNPLEAFIHNYSIPYSPLKRHLVGDTNSETLRDTLIKEVTTKTFNDTVMDPEKDVLLFYYTQWCGFCSVLNHVLIQLAHFFQFNQMFTVSRINAAKNDLPWEYMVDRFPTILFFPSDRKHLSVKFPDAPINLPNLVRFVIRYSSRRSSSEVHGQAAPNPPTKAGSLQAQMVHLENEVNKLHREVHTLQLAKDQLSRQLSEVRHEKRQLTIHAHTLEKRNTELQLQGNELEKLYEQKKQELDDTVEKLQELADASENLLTENTLLKILMASMKEERKAALTETSSSSDEHLLDKSDSQREEL